MPFRRHKNQLCSCAGCFVLVMEGELLCADHWQKVAPKLRNRYDAATKSRDEPKSDMFARQILGSIEDIIM